jgi:hypothetical protein
MPVPIIYSQERENVIASYNYTDLIQNVGVIRFYGGGTRDSAGVKLRLDTNTFYPSTSGAYSSDDCYSTVSDANATIIDIDFDSSVFSLPRTIRGVMLSNIPFSMTSPSSEGSGSITCTVNLIKVDAANAETTIVSTNSNKYSFTAGEDNADKYFSIQSTVPLTTIKKGEKLRVNIVIVGSDVGATSSTVTIYYDTLNRAWISNTAGFTLMQFLIPFKIDL